MDGSQRTHKPENIFAVQTVSKIHPQSVLHSKAFILKVLVLKA